MKIVVLFVVNIFSILVVLGQNKTDWSKYVGAPQKAKSFLEVDSLYCNQYGNRYKFGEEKNRFTKLPAPNSVEEYFGNLVLGAPVNLPVNFPPKLKSILLANEKVIVKPYLKLHYNENSTKYVVLKFEFVKGEVERRETTFLVRKSTGWEFATPKGDSKILFDLVSIMKEGFSSFPEMEELVSKNKSANLSVFANQLLSDLRSLKTSNRAVFNKICEE